MSKYDPARIAAMKAGQRDALDAIRGYTDATAIALIDDGLILAEIALRLQAEPRTIQRIAKAHGRTIRAKAPETWTTATTQRLRDLWALGMSTAKIGRELGLNKSAVIGKANRLGLTARENPIKSGSNPRPKEVPVLPIPPRSAVPDLFIVPSKPLPVALVPLRVVAATGLRGGCQWPLWGHRERPRYGADGMPLLCGDPLEVGSYCGTHGAVCFVQRRQRVEEAA